MGRKNMNLDKSRFFLGGAVLLGGGIAVVNAQTAKNPLETPAPRSTELVGPAPGETGATVQAKNQARFVMFDDREQSGWFSHHDSFPTTDKMAYKGSRSIGFAQPNKGYQFPMGWTGSISSEPYDAIEFYVNGGESGGQTLVVKGLLRDVIKDTFDTANTIRVPDEAGKYLEGGAKVIPANKWTKVTIPLADLGVAKRKDFRGVRFEVGEKAGFFVDEIALVGNIPTTATITVNTAREYRKVNDNIFGVDTYGIPEAHNADEVATSRHAGYRLQRSFYPTFNIRSGIFRSNVHKGLLFADAAGSEQLVCVNYTDMDAVEGNNTHEHGTPQEAAALVAYANVPIDAPARVLDMKLGVDKHGRDMGTVRRWVNLRANEAKLEKDDGMNQLRIGRKEPFKVKYWELDNEPWLRPERTDWLGYANFCKEADKLMKQIDPTIHTGVTLLHGGGPAGLGNRKVLSAHTGKETSEYNDVLLHYLSGKDQQLSPGRLVPDFIVEHNYTGTNHGPSANLATLFTFQNRAGSDWDSIAQAFRTQLNAFYGAADGAKPYYIVTESNIAATFPLSKQTTSLVTALYAADSMASLLQSKPGDFEGFTWHDWHDGGLSKGGYHENEYLYNWRNEGTYSIYFNGTRTKYPVHYAYRLLSHFFAHQGDSVVEANTSTAYLQSYAVRQQNGNLAILLINKSEQQDIAATFKLQGYTPAKAATVYRFGKVEDRNEADVTPTAITYDAARPLVMPPYSMTVVTLTQSRTTPKPAAPTYVHALPGANKVNLIWTAMSGATTYDVHRGTSAADIKPLKTGIVTNSFDDTTATAGKTFVYRVIAKNAAGVSAPSPTAQATIVAAPGAVQNLVAVPEVGQVTLKWNDVPGATRYTVKRGASANGPFETLTTHPYFRNYNENISFNRYTDRTAKTGTAYHYVVTATNSGGESTPARVAAAPVTLPDNWRAVDTHGRKDGHTGYDAKTGKWTLAGSGEAWYSNGHGRFAYQKLSGDGTITARVLSGETGRYEKNVFGVMLRQNPTGGGFWAMMAATPSNPGNNATQGFTFMNSDMGKGAKQTFQSEDLRAPEAEIMRLPYWVRLERKGNTIKGYYSKDGKEWKTHEQAKMTADNMPQELHVGLIANSMVYYAPLQGEFDNVTVTGKTSAP
jgi:hypothetical protein